MLLQIGLDMGGKVDGLFTIETVMGRQRLVAGPRPVADLLLGRDAPVPLGRRSLIENASDEVDLRPKFGKHRLIENLLLRKPECLGCP